MDPFASCQQHSGPGGSLPALSGHLSSSSYLFSPAHDSLSLKNTLDRQHIRPPSTPSPVTPTATGSVLSVNLSGGDGFRRSATPRATQYSDDLTSRSASLQAGHSDTGIMGSIEPHVLCVAEATESLLLRAGNIPYAIAKQQTTLLSRQIDTLQADKLYNDLVLKIPQLLGMDAGTLASGPALSGTAAAQGGPGNTPAQAKHCIVLGLGWTYPQVREMPTGVVFKYWFASAYKERPKKGGKQGPHDEKLNIAQLFVEDEDGYSVSGTVAKDMREMLRSLLHSLVWSGQAAPLQDQLSHEAQQASTRVPPQPETTAAQDKAVVVATSLLSISESMTTSSLAPGSPVAGPVQTVGAGSVESPTAPQDLIIPPPAPEIVPATGRIIVDQHAEAGHDDNAGKAVISVRNPFPSLIVSSASGATSRRRSTRLSVADPEATAIANPIASVNDDSDTAAQAAVDGLLHEPLFINEDRASNTSDSDPARRASGTWMALPRGTALLAKTKHKADVVSEQMLFMGRMIAENPVVLHTDYLAAFKNLSANEREQLKQDCIRERKETSLARDSKLGDRDWQAMPLVFHPTIVRSRCSSGTFSLGFMVKQVESKSSKWGLVQSGTEANLVIKDYLLVTPSHLPHCMVMHHMGCLTIVTGKNSKKPATCKKSEQWEKHLELAITIISLKINPNQYDYIQNTKTSPEAWSALQEAYERNTYVYCIALKHRVLQNTPIRECTNCVMNHLKSIGIALLDDGIINILSINLHLSWVSIASSLSIFQMLGLTKVVSALTNEEVHCKVDFRASNSSNDTALVACKNCYFDKRPHSVNICYICGKPDRIAYGCPKRINITNLVRMSHMDE
ncbi:hypothetical protein FKP32DRAFT_1605950 [Trametes sanguinea]|nr:hypothetical protein FKP32DRAFT_1605950 [Trametes sanguinea]